MLEQGVTPAPQRKQNWLATASIIANVALVGALVFYASSGSDVASSMTATRSMNRMVMPMSMNGRRPARLQVAAEQKPIVSTVALDAPVATTEEQMTCTSANGFDVDA